MADEHDTRLGAEERSQLRGRVLAGIHAPRRPAGGIVAGVAAVAAVAVVVAVAWTAAASRPAPVAATPSPTASAEEVVGLWLPEGDGRLERSGSPYLLILGDGTLVGHFGACPGGFGGEWEFDAEAGEAVVGKGLLVNGIGCPDAPPPAVPLSGSDRLAVDGDTLRVTNSEGDTAILHRSPAVQYRAGVVIATLDGTTSSDHESVLLAGTLARYETGVGTHAVSLLGIDDGTRVVPVVFPAGTRLREDGQAIEVEGVGTILVGDELSATGGPTSEDLWGPPLPSGVESFAAGEITR